MIFSCIVFLGFVKIAGSYEGRPCISGQNVVANCNLEGKSCGTGMIYKIFTKLHSPRNVNMTMCVLHCICANAEFIQMNEEHFKNPQDSVQSQYSECKKENCTIGETIVDYGCKRAEMKCATNMKFKVISELKSNGAHRLTKCFLRCECDSNNFIEKSGKCIKKVPNEEAKCKQENCALGEIVVASSCIQTETKCGTNMVFKLIGKLDSLSDAIWLRKCIMRCSCDNNYFIEKSGQCVRVIHERVPISSIQPSSKHKSTAYSPLSCENGNCLRQIIWDACHRIGNKCGTNMVFDLVYENHSGDSCLMRCVCNSESVENNGRCVESSLINEKTIPKFIAPRFLTANKKIYNRDCRRIQLECGKNMKMISIWKNPTDHHDRFACIQYCTCINNEYIGRNGRCE